VIRSMPLYSNGGAIELAVKGAAALTGLKERITDELAALLS
jgi:hypothetical protein